MRESTLWATQGGPIVGEIKNGKKYPFGTVPATEYDADMQALRTEIAGLNTAVVSCEGTLSGLQTALDTLAGQYAATVPGLSQSISDLRVQVGDVSAALTAATQSLTASISAVDTKADNIDESCGQRINGFFFNDTATTEIYTDHRKRSYHKHQRSYRQNDSCRGRYSGT